MADPTAAFAKLVPGFDFLQGLVKNAGAALPNVGQWVAPTLDPAELEKRIEELRTVQFWLEQNARMLGATIQALEVQRMTLSTLKTMNVSLGDLTESLKIKLPDPPASTAAAMESAGGPVPAPPADEASARTTTARSSAKGDDQEDSAQAAVPAVPPGVPDPMQWWGALTKQFTELAANAMKDSATDAAKNLGAAMVKQGFEAASETMKKAAAMPAAMVKTAAGVAQNAAQAAQASQRAAQQTGKARTTKGSTASDGGAGSSDTPAAPARKRSPVARKRPSAGG
jgi:hypothetical protein